MDFFDKAIAVSQRAEAESLKAKVWPQPLTPEQQSEQAISQEKMGDQVVDYAAENKRLAQNLATKNFWEQQDAYTKASQLATQVWGFDISKEARLSIARSSFQQAKWRAWDDKEINDFLVNNRNTVEKNMYQALVAESRKQWADFSQDKFYSEFISRELAKSTPKAPPEKTFWEKAWDVARSITATPIWATLLATDSLGITEGAYQQHFQWMTDLKAWASFWEKWYDLFISQWAILDVALWWLSYAKWFAAPLFVSARTAMKGGTAAVTKWLFKDAEKAWVLEAFETALKNDFWHKWDELIKSLKWQWDDISTFLIKNGWNDPVKYLQKFRWSVQTVWEKELRKAWANEKAIENFRKNSDRVFSDLGVKWWALNKVTAKERQADMLQLLSDVSGVGYGAVHVVNEWWKEVFKYSGTIGRALFQYWFPASPLIPWGVGEFMQDYVMWASLKIWSAITQATRWGIVEKERQKFVEDYWIDPEKANGSLRESWNNYINFQLKYSSFSEMMTGTKMEERTTWEKWWWGALDTAVMALWPIAGIHAIGKWAGYVDKKLSPFTYENGHFQYNLGYMQEFETIIKDTQLDEKWRSDRLADLNDRVAKWDTSLVTTIQSAREFQRLADELHETYKNSWATIRGIDDVADKMYQEASELFSQGRHAEAGAKIAQAEVFVKQSVDGYFNSETLKNVQEKMKLVNTYFNKLRSSHKMMDELSKTLSVNLFTKALISETGAVIRGSDALASKALSQLNMMANQNDKIVNIHTKKYEAFNETIRTGGRMMIETENIIRQNLQNDWLSVEQSNAIINAISPSLHRNLTRAFLSIDALKDKNLSKVFSDIFPSLGLKDVTEVLQKTTGATWATDISKLLAEIRWETSWLQLEQKIPMDEALFEKINLQRQNDMQAEWLVREEILKATEHLSVLNQLKADLANRLHQEREVLRQQMATDDPKAMTNTTASENVKASDEHMQDTNEKLETTINEEDEARLLADKALDEVSWAAAIVLTRVRQINTPIAEQIDKDDPIHDTYTDNSLRDTFTMKFLEDVFLKNVTNYKKLAEHILSEPNLKERFAWLREFTDVKTAWAQQNIDEYIQKIQEEINKWTPVLAVDPEIKTLIEELKNRVELKARADEIAPYIEMKVDKDLFDELVEFDEKYQNASDEERSGEFWEYIDEEGNDMYRNKYEWTEWLDIQRIEYDKIVSDLGYKDLNDFIKKKNEIEDKQEWIWDVHNNITKILDQVKEWYIEKGNIIDWKTPLEFLQKIFKEQFPDKEFPIQWLTEMTAGVNTKRINGLSNTIKRYSNIQKGNLTRDTLIDMAKKSNTLEEFHQQIQKYLSSSFLFTKEFSDEFITKAFGSVLWLQPYYNFLKSTHKINATKIVLWKDGWVTFYKDAQLDPLEESEFMDKYGNFSDIYRQEWLGEKNLSEYDLAHIIDIKQDGKPVNAIGLYRENKWNVWEQNFHEVEEKMNERGYFYIGSFQEEWKKILFVRPKEWSAIDNEFKRIDADNTITDKNSAKQDVIENDTFRRMYGIDKSIVESMSKEDQNKVAANITKRNKIFLWWEVRPTPEIAKKHLPDSRPDKVKTLVFEAEWKSWDWRELYLPHMQDLVNEVIWADPLNDSFKTAASESEKGQVQKGKAWVMNASHLSDPKIAEAVKSYIESDPQGFDLSNFSDPNWIRDSAIRDKVFEHLKITKPFEKITPTSVIKNIFGKLPSDRIVSNKKEDQKDISKGLSLEATKKVEQAWIHFYQSWEAFETPINEIWLKTHDEYTKPEAREHEVVSFANQALAAVQQTYADQWQSAVAFHRVYNSIKDEAFARIKEILSTIDNPIQSIKALKDEFGIAFSSHEEREFYSSLDTKNIENLVQNILKKYVETGIKVKGNKLDLTYIPNQKEVEEVINEHLKKEDPKKDMQDHFVILDDNYYSHLKNEDGTRSQFITFRYPIVARQVMTAPYIIWKSELNTWMREAYDADSTKWDINYDPHIGSAIAASEKIVKRVEWDGDGDSLFMITDKRFQDKHSEIFPYFETVFRDPRDKWDTGGTWKTVEIQTRKVWENGNTKKNLQDMSFRELLREHQFEQFNGKAQVWVLTNDAMRFETMANIGLINPALLEDVRTAIGNTWQASVDNELTTTMLKKRDKLEKDAIGWTAYDMNQWEMVIELPNGVRKTFKMQWLEGNEPTGYTVYFINYPWKENKSWKDEWQIWNSIVNATNKTKKVKEWADYKYTSPLIFLDPNMKYGWGTLWEQNYRNLLMNSKVLTDLLKDVFTFYDKFSYSNWVQANRKLSEFHIDYNNALWAAQMLQRLLWDKVLDDPIISYVLKNKDNFQNLNTNFFWALSRNTDKAFNNLKKSSGLWAKVWELSSESDKLLNGDWKDEIGLFARYSELKKISFDLLRKVKEDSKLFKRLEEYGFRKDMAESAFFTLKKQTLGKQIKDMLDISFKEKKFSFDDYIVDKAKSFRDLQKDLLSPDTQKKINDGMLPELEMLPYNRLYSELTNNHLINISDEKFKDEFLQASYQWPKAVQDVISKYMKGYEDLVDAHNNGALSYTTSDMIPTIITAKAVGISTSDIQDTFHKLNQIDSESRSELFKVMSSIPKEDLHKFFDNSDKDNNIVQELIKLWVSKQLIDQNFQKTLKERLPTIQRSPNAINISWCS